MWISPVYILTENNHFHQDYHTLGNSDSVLLMSVIQVIHFLKNNPMIFSINCTINWGREGVLSWTTLV